MERVEPESAEECRLLVQEMDSIAYKPSREF